MPRPKQTTSRYRRRIEVRITAPGQVPHIGYSGNISMAGVMVRTPRVHPPGTILAIELRFPDESIRLTGKVVWAREGSLQWLASGRIGMGIKFIDPPADLAELLRP
jgi:Tfp pilus assembly protein PilZ